MISFGFKTLHIWIKNIRGEVGIYTPTLQFQFGLGLSNIRRICFFPIASEINKIQVPFTIGIQTLTQCESMLSYGHNNAISMDATFGTNDMKFHLFTLMGFDDHRMGFLLAWIITNRQIVEDLIKWLKPLKDKMLSHMPHWKPSCFFIDNAPQELKALWLVLYLMHIWYLFPWMFLLLFFIKNFITFF
jgi:hypothetical protein